ncbi:CDP-alcohol phosphatidyltransferase family protein [Alkalimarinus alittae]|uniref:CDP-diacylglycerol--glycerol-3-phosphate 3-phosphatidyltransferase n=1 Tax=Alkalimarinus alittae TaxID=2961619 RepID=A0ABY6MZ20_9ALTE|nr:CDP-alcohol phosphatidyltransferase family protein [Alkalimarinus alittae]UZE95002.1 CDP-alcohol phosphatidyltransferase family protein [Alkalimarinus alittae]
MFLEWRHLPNLLTFLRIILVIPFAACLYFEYFKQALILFFIAGLSDGVDGFLARQFHWKSRFGEIADPLADKLLLVTAYVMLTIAGHLPIWLTAVVFGRDIIIVSCALIYHYWIGAYEMKPSMISKLNTFVQIVYVLAIVVSLSGFDMPLSFLYYGVWAVAALAVLSCVQYAYVWGRKAYIYRKSIKA